MKNTSHRMIRDLNILIQIRENFMKMKMAKQKLLPKVSQ